MKYKRDRETERRLLAAAIMCAAAMAAVLLAVAVIQPRNPEAFGRMAAPFVIGFGVIGWRWPDSILAPFSRLFRRR
jgi:hypothetical protein